MNSDQYKQSIGGQAEDTFVPGGRVEDTSAPSETCYGLVVTDADTKSKIVDESVSNEAISESKVLDDSVVRPVCDNLLNCAHNLKLSCYCYRLKMANSSDSVKEENRDETKDHENVAGAATTTDPTEVPEHPSGSGMSNEMGEAMPGEIISDSEGEVVYVGENERDGIAAQGKDCKTSTPLNNPK